MRNPSRPSCSSSPAQLLPLLLVSSFTTRHFFKQTPSFTLISPMLSPLPLFLRHSPSLARPPAWLVLVILISKDPEFHVSKPHTLSLGTIVCTGGSCREKNRRHIGDRVRGEGGRKKEKLHATGARFSRWGYLIGPIG